MNKQEFEKLMKKGECQRVEFKKSANWIDKEITAFANSDGGRIFLGVDDDGKVKGIKITNKLKSQIQNVARGCDPSIKINLDEFENVLIINIDEGNDKPYKCPSGFYLRQGANSQKMTRDDILEFAVGEGKVRFDEQINEDFNFEEDFDEEKLNLFLKENNLFTELDPRDVLVSLGLALRKGERLFLNNAGVLFFAKESQKFFLHAYLDCVLFKGRDKTNIIDRKIFRFDLLNQLFSAKEFVKKHLNLSYKFKEFEREEKYEIPLRAIEEALVNALIHRDYFFKGANISLFIYDNRLEVVSPGGLPKGLDKKDFGRLSVRRNRIIADIFSKTPYAEQIGSGVKRMKNLVRKCGLPVPIFEMNNFFVVTFKREHRDTIKDTMEDTIKLLPDNEKIILIEISKNLKITTDELSCLLGINIRNTKKNISKLKQKNLLKRIGHAKGGHWEIIK